MADDLRLHLRFPLRREALCRALYQIRVHYRDTPYHNFRHAFDVSQCVYLFVRSCPSLALSFKPYSFTTVTVACDAAAGGTATNKAARRAPANTTCHV